MQAPAKFENPGPKILLVGATGTGKTHSIKTLLDAGLKVFVVFTEPGMETVADIPCSRGLHWTYVKPAPNSWDDLMAGAKAISEASSNEALQKTPGISKAKYRQWYDLLGAMSTCKCDRCGETFGPSDQLGMDWAVVNDSLSGICLMSSKLTVGAKPIKTQPDWGVMMDNVENYITQFTTAINCTGVMIAHLERESDEVTGSQILMASSLGRKLSPKIPRFFSDVINAKRDGTNFSWSTVTLNTDLKARNVAWSDKIPPTFAPLIKTWRDRNAKGLV